MSGFAGTRFSGRRAASNLRNTAGGRARVINGIDQERSEAGATRLAQKNGGTEDVSVELWDKVDEALAP